MKLIFENWRKFLLTEKLMLKNDKEGRGWSLYGELVTEADDLSPAIERGIKSGLPALIDVVTNPDATSAATHAITAMMTR